MDHPPGARLRSRLRRSAAAGAVIAFLLAACGGGVERWDGSPYADRPVYGAGAERGVSQRLHDDADECGIGDDVIVDVMAGVVEGGVTDIHRIFSAGGGGADVTLTQLDDQTWELRLSC